MVLGSRPKLKKISNNVAEAPCFVIGETNIEIVQKTKYLGTMVDQHLVLEEHTKFLLGKISRVLRFLQYAKKFLPMQTLNLIYKGIVEPHFRYCCSVWGCCGESREETLQKLQNRTAIIVTNSSYNLPASTLLGNLKWPSINEIINGETVTMDYKSLNGLAPNFLSELVTKVFFGKE